MLEMSVDRVNESSGINSGYIRTSVNNAANSGANFSNILNAAISSGKADLDKIFQAASEKYNVPVNLLKAVAKAESNFNPKALSSCGAQGIMQLMPSTARGLGVTDPYDPEQNIMGGAKYLSGMLERFGGNTQLALAAYNAGAGSVMKYGGIPPFAETQNYVKKVMDYCGENLSAGTVADSPGKADALEIWQLMHGGGTLDPETQTPDEMAAMVQMSMYRLQADLFSDSTLFDNSNGF
jgi:hypothetical protein